MGSMATEFGEPTLPPKGEPWTGVALPVVVFKVKTDKLFESRLATTAKASPGMALESVILSALAEPLAVLAVRPEITGATAPSNASARKLAMAANTNRNAPNL
jgi:hypothetical protein